jgi:hypothetical protein
MPHRLPAAASAVGLAAIVLAGIVAALPVGAQPLYRWTDDSGRVHITDDPNQIPHSRGPEAPPPDPRTAARDAVQALRSLAALTSEEPAHEAYSQGVTDARRVVDVALGSIERGGLRAALAGALTCYHEAAELWDNQLAVRRGMDLTLNMAPIRQAWQCGADKTAEAERLLATSR